MDLWRPRGTLRKDTVLDRASRFDQTLDGPRLGRFPGRGAQTAGPEDPLGTWAPDGPTPRLSSTGPSTRSSTVLPWARHRTLYALKPKNWTSTGPQQKSLTGAPKDKSPATVTPTNEGRPPLSRGCAAPPRRHPGPRRNPQKRPLYGVQSGADYERDERDSTTDLLRDGPSNPLETSRSSTRPSIGPSPFPRLGLMLGPSPGVDYGPLRAPRTPRNDPCKVRHWALDRA
ncbi:hypothetical protein M885DRAFT_129982 [Pelagophyceae sp. CCMP2097]|nr:hypothetical protein M885DRAFT_129982 [Pelagophyceae sp. CCMP2097]